MDFGYCPHISALKFISDEINKLNKQVKKCSACEYYGSNLWICLKRGCQFVGCPEKASDHSTEHFHNNKTHCVHMNVSSNRIWCYTCDREIFLQEDVSSTTTTVTNKKNNFDTFCLLTNPASDGLVGLHNIANTCYMNSALQALSNIPPMTQYFLECADLISLKSEHETIKCKTGLAKNYARLMEDMWCKKDGDLECIVPRGILYGIRSVHPMFRGYQQHDTQEFLRCFMDQLHEELKEPSNPLCDYLFSHSHEQKAEPEYFSPTNSLSESEYETCDSSASESSNVCTATIAHDSLQKKKGTVVKSVQQHTNRSVITDIFDGKLLSSVQCLACDRVSTREETFQDLSLPIPTRDYLHVLHQTQSLSSQSLGSSDMNAELNETWLSWIWSLVRSWVWGPSVTLYDCMASFFSADELKGDNMYSCEKCSKLRTGIKYSKILNLPEVLCIHLKRFRHDIFYSSKISSHVNFPLESLDMAPYLHKTCKSRVLNYNLVSVICHHGTVGGGHYTCLARNDINNNWYEYDDQHVTEVTPETVQNSQAYVLFYRKFNPQMNLNRTEANQISILNPIHQSDIRFYVARDWLCRFNSFAEPGPINNQDILCPHGGIIQSKINSLKQIAIPIPQQLWDFFYSKYGGGPAINMLYECDICKRATEAINRRQLYELSVFSKYNEQKSDDDSCAIYAISMPWLRKWQQFVRGNTSQEPGSITNFDISKVNDSPPILNCKYNVRPGSDFAQLTSPLWHFLHGIYGGGPEIILRESLNTEIDASEVDNKDLNDNLSDTESNIGQEITSVLVGDKDKSSISETPILDVQSYAQYDQEHFLETRNLRKSKMKIRGGIRKSDMFGTAGTYTPSVDVDRNNDITYRGGKKCNKTNNNSEVKTDNLRNSSKGNGIRHRSRAKGKIKCDEVKLQKFCQLQQSNSESTETDT